MKNASEKMRLTAAVILAAIIALTAVWTRGALVKRAELSLAAPAQAEEEEGENDRERFFRPTEGEELRGYSAREPIWSETLAAYEAHEGVDLAAGADGLVYACCEGHVTAAGEEGRYGLTVRTENEEGFAAAYASLDAAFVKAGDKVRAGQAIGRAGTSAVCEQALGPHVHFSFFDGQEIAPPPFTSAAE